MTPRPVPPGLKGVAVTDTAIGDVRGLEGFYHYRQYSATELAASAAWRTSGSFCSTARLPAGRHDGSAFAAEVRPARPLPA